MDPLSQLAVLAQRLEEYTWRLPAAELRERESDFRAECQRCQVALEQVLAALSDETLVLAVQKEFCLHKAFEELFPKRYEQRLRYWFGTLGVESNLAFDLTQQIYLQFYRTRVHGFEPLKPFAGFLYRTARNLWISKVFRARRLVLANDLPEPGGADTTAEAVLARELEGRLPAALGGLSADERAVMELSLNGLEASEIAAKLGTPVARVHRLLFNARQKIKTALAITLPPKSADDREVLLALERMGPLIKAVSLNKPPQTEEYQCKTNVNV